jgi:hypothetical protein
MRGERSEDAFNLRPQRRGVTLSDFPDGVPIDFEVVVNDGMAHAGNCAPGHCRVGILERRRQSPRGLADDLDVAHDVRPDEFIGVEFGAWEGWSSAPR